MIAEPRKLLATEGDLSFTPTSGTESEGVVVQPFLPSGGNPRSRYMNRPSNYEIGRAAEKKGIMVREFDRSDRWVAWRKRAAKAKRAALLRTSKAGKKRGKKPQRKA